MPRKKNEIIIFLTAVFVLSVLWPGASARAQETNSLSDRLKIPLSDSTAVEDSIPCPQNDSLAEAASPAEPDSVILEPTPYISGADTVLIKAYSSIDTIQPYQPAPTLMLLKSVLFPGAGQFDNGKYLKAAAVFVTETYLIYQILRYNRRTSEWRQLWKAPSQSEGSLTAVLPMTLQSPTSVGTASLKSDYFQKYTSNRDTRNSYIWYTALTVFVSMFDAYVDAQLRNFPKKGTVQRGLSVDMAPGEETRLSLRYNF
jgi:hypothetical protein